MTETETVNIQEAWSPVQAMAKQKQTKLPGSRGGYALNFVRFRLGKKIEEAQLDDSTGLLEISLLRRSPAKG